MTVSAAKTTEKLDTAGQNEQQETGRDSSSVLKSGKFGSNSQTQRENLRAWSQAADSANPQLYRAKVKRAELILFTTQLSVMLDSGVVLSDALDAIAEQAENGKFKMVIEDVAETVKSGENFSKALTGYPRIFNSMFISMVKASEASGRMAQMLDVLSGYLSFECETRKQIKGALTYPFIMALMAVAATGTLMFFVLPRFMKIYEAKGAALPKITQILVAFSSMLANFKIMTVVLTTLILASTGLYYWARTLTGRRVIDFFKIRTPVLGTMFTDMVVTRSMRIMATMLNTGVKLLEAIEVIQGSCENYYFQQLWAGTNEKICDGYQLSESILLSPSCDLIAPGIIQMLRAGEKSGKLGEVCDKISVFYEKKLEASIKNVMALIEPLMITIMGSIIGTIAIALLLPVFRISSVMAH